MREYLYLRFEQYTRNSLEFINNIAVDNNDYNIMFDFLSLETSYILMNEKIDVVQGNISVVKNQENDIVSIGIIDEIDAFRITYSPFIRILELLIQSVKFNNATSIEAQLVILFTEIFTTNADNFQNIPYVEFDKSTDTFGEYSEEDKKINTIDFLQTIMFKFQIIPIISIDLKNKITYTFTRLTSTQLFLKDNFKMYDLEITKDIMAENKAIFLNNSEAETDIYYLTTDNLLTTLSTAINRVLPVQTIYIDEQVGSDNLELAKQNLIGNIYNHQIIFAVDFNTKIIDVKNLKIGTLFNLNLEGESYESILTGIGVSNANDQRITLKFGKTRKNLTEI